MSHKATSARRMHSSIRIRRPLVPNEALHRGSTRWAACLEPFLVYTLAFWPVCRTTDRVCPRCRVYCLVSLSRPLTDPQTGALSCTARRTSGVSYPAHGFKYPYSFSCARFKYMLRRPLSDESSSCHPMTSTVFAEFCMQSGCLDLT
jgi:hypothetical protein